MLNLQSFQRNPFEVLCKKYQIVKNQFHITCLCCAEFREVVYHVSPAGVPGELPGDILPAPPLALPAGT